MSGVGGRGGALELNISFAVHTNIETKRFRRLLLVYLVTIILYPGIPSKKDKMFARRGPEAARRATGPGPPSSPLLCPRGQVRLYRESAGLKNPESLDFGGIQCSQGESTPYE